MSQQPIANWMSLFWLQASKKYINCIKFLFDFFLFNLISVIDGSLLLNFVVFVSNRWKAMFICFEILILCLCFDVKIAFPSIQSVMCICSAHRYQLEGYCNICWIWFYLPLSLRSCYFALSIVLTVYTMQIAFYFLLLSSFQMLHFPQIEIGFANTIITSDRQRHSNSAHLVWTVCSVYTEPDRCTCNTHMHTV